MTTNPETTSANESQVTSPSRLQQIIADILCNGYGTAMGAEVIYTYSHLLKLGEIILTAQEAIERGVTQAPWSSATRTTMELAIFYSQLKEQEDIYGMVQDGISSVKTAVSSSRSLTSIIHAASSISAATFASAMVSFPIYNACTTENAPFSFYFPNLIHEDFGAATRSMLGGTLTTLHAALCASLYFSQLYGMNLKTVTNFFNPKVFDHHAKEKDEKGREIPGRAYRLRKDQNPTSDQEALFTRLNSTATVVFCGLMLLHCINIVSRVLSLTKASLVFTGYAEDNQALSYQDISTQIALALSIMTIMLTSLLKRTMFINASKTIAYCRELCYRGKFLPHHPFDTGILIALFANTILSTAINAPGLDGSSSYWIAFSLISQFIGVFACALNVPAKLADIAILGKEENAELPAAVQRNLERMPKRSFYSQAGDLTGQARTNDRSSSSCFANLFRNSNTTTYQEFENEVQVTDIETGYSPQ